MVYVKVDENNNNIYDVGEGTEYNGQYDGPIVIDGVELFPGEFYLDIGIDGLTDIQEAELGTNPNHSVLHRLTGPVNRSP